MGVRWKVEDGSEGKMGGKSRHGTSTHHQFFVAMESDDGGQFLSGADGLPGNVTVHVQPDALQPDSQPVSLQTIDLHCSGAAGGGARGRGKGAGQSHSHTQAIEVEENNTV